MTEQPGRVRPFSVMERDARAPASSRRVAAYHSRRSPSSSAAAFEAASARLAALLWHVVEANQIDVSPVFATLDGDDSQTARGRVMRRGQQGESTDLNLSIRYRLLTTT
jgi:hypothetical protein